ncbi:hypothetical protein GCM10009646_47400 [Streptomyces aureus]
MTAAMPRKTGLILRSLRRVAAVVMEDGSRGACGLVRCGVDGLTVSVVRCGGERAGAGPGFRETGGIVPTAPP